MTDALKLNFGCGKDYMNGWVNVDHSEAVRTDLCGDIYTVFGAYGYDAFDRVLLRHVFEHIQDQMEFMELLYRACAPGAQVEIYCPYWSSADAWADPDHKHAISENTFFHFNRAAYLWGPNNPITAAHSDRYLPDCDFQPIETRYGMASEFAGKTDAEMAYARKHLLNSVAEFQVVLEVIKPPREK